MSDPSITDSSEVSDRSESSVDVELNPSPPVHLSLPKDPSQAWYLGIDLGTTGLSAVLLERNSRQFYPIFWIEGDARETRSPLFRLPAAVYLPTEPLAAESATTKITVGSAALHQAWGSSATAALVATRSLPDMRSPEGLLQNFKPYLKVGIPYPSPITGQWEPIIQNSDDRQTPLHWVQQAVQALLGTLQATTADATTIGATGLDQSIFQQALSHLEGVVVGYPSHWPDTYNFNIREAILSTQLVAQPEQIFFVEDAIAAVLSGLRHPERSQWRGSTLVINAGATAIDLLLVHLPEQLAELNYSDFNLRSFPYAGDALDQDIVCQLLYPQWFREPRSSSDTEPNSTAWQWQATHLAAKHLTWDSLKLESLALPLPGEPDLVARHRLQQRLENSLLGKMLLEAARHLKVILQHEDHCTFELGDQRWLIQRKQLESLVLLPFIQRLNRELNGLLSQTGVSAPAINQAICTGGTASLPVIARWLRQKLPNATIIQDAYQQLDERNSNNLGVDEAELHDAAQSTQPQAAFSSDRLLSCSRVAYGLATLPLYPQVLDLPRHQYSDYFLLLELLRVFPTQPISVSGIMQLLERRGINTQVCHLHILALLEGHLPPGLIPTESDQIWLAPTSRQHLKALELNANPLFYKEGNQIYHPNPEQGRRLRHYLESVLVQTQQTLEDPLAVNLNQTPEQSHFR